MSSVTQYSFLMQLRSLEWSWESVRGKILTAQFRVKTDSYDARLQLCFCMQTSMMRVVYESSLAEDYHDY